jgi:hypothetical protein
METIMGFFAAKSFPHLQILAFSMIPIKILSRYHTSLQKKREAKFPGFVRKKTTNMIDMEVFFSIHESNE